MKVFDKQEAIRSIMDSYIKTSLMIELCEAKHVPFVSIKTNVGMRVDINHELSESADFDYNIYMVEIGKAFADYIDREVLNKISRFNKATGISGKHLSVLSFEKAIDTVKAIGNVVAVLHPYTVFRLRDSAGVLWDGLNKDVDIRHSICCSSINSHRDRLGVVMPFGLNGGIRLAYTSVDIKMTETKECIEYEIKGGVSAVCFNPASGVRIISRHE